MAAIEIQAVGKLFGEKPRLLPLKEHNVKGAAIRAVDNVTLRVEAGEVCGLLGANGAGKTTLIKLITGLLSPTTGKISVCGCDLAAHKREALAHIGAVIEEPSFFAGLSGRENLKYFALLQGGVDDGQVARTVELVGMSARIDGRYGNYSMGMRQRIGIAQALMHDPDVLVLDEPTNGLDPESIMQMRDLLKKLAHEYGKCVLVSSHILGEMQQLCDRVCIMKEGRVVAQVGDVDRIGNCISAIKYVCARPEEGRRLLVETYGEIKTKVDGNRLYVKPPEDADGEAFAAAVNKLLAENDVGVISSEFKRRTLEDVYREVAL